MSLGMNSKPKAADNAAQLSSLSVSGDSKVVSDGTLNAFIAPQSSGEYEEGTEQVTVKLTGVNTAPNGKMTVTYDASALTFVGITGHTEAFAYTVEDGKITVAFAAAAELPVDTVVATLTFDVIKSGEHTITGSETGIRAKSATMMMESMIIIRVYFILESGYSIEDFAFTIDGKEVQPKYNAKGYYIETDGIPAKHMDEMHDFCVGGITVRYSALSYINSKMNASDPLEVELAKDLYAYYVAAEALLG